MMYHVDHVVRHNLGMYEMLYAIVLTIILYSVKNVRPFDGFHPALMLLLYSPARFMFDYLREQPIHGGDRRYFGLTPGQYFAVGMVLLAVVLIVRGVHRRRAGTEGPGLPPTPAKAHGGKPRKAKR